MKYDERNNSNSSRSEKDKTILGNRSNIVGTEALYDQNFANDPLSNNWKTRWLDKNLEGRKYKRNKLSQSGYYDKLTNPSNMYSLIQSNGNDKSGNNNRTARRRNDYGSHVNQDYQVPSRRRNDNYIQTARGGWYKLAETERDEEGRTARRRNDNWGKYHYRKQPYQSKSTSDLHKMRTQLVTPFAVDY